MVRMNFNKIHCFSFIVLPHRMMGSSEDLSMNVELPVLPLLQPQDLPSFALPSNPHGSMPKVLSSMFQHMKKMKWVLTNLFQELEERGNRLHG